MPSTTSSPEASCGPSTTPSGSSLVPGDLGRIRFGGTAGRPSSHADDGIPQVVVPGGVDHIGVMLDEPNVVPARYQGRTYTFHNPSILVPRTSGEELTRVAGTIGERLAGVGDQAVFMLPLAGVSSYSVTGGALVDREADAVLWAALRIRSRVASGSSRWRPVPRTRSSSIARSRSSWR